jgi:hypothetical protein
MQYYLPNLADRANAYLTMGLAVVNPLDNWPVEKKYRKLDR